MNKQFTNTVVITTMTVLIWLASLLHLSAQGKDITITIHLRGVYESKISLLALSTSKTFKPIVEVPGIKDGKTTIITVTKDHLPGEFVLRFDYREKETSTPYPSEKNLFIHKQDLELWVSPKYCNNADSTHFQADERENDAFMKFSKENGKQKEQLGLLQTFLMGYDDTESAFYREGRNEFEQRRTKYNQWISTRTRQDKELFVSNLYCFQYVPEISWTGTEAERMKSLASHYFDGMDFSDPLIVKTAELNKWMDGYVNLYGRQSTTIALRDSLFSQAGRTAIEKARKGHPLVYGWMVDYFYRGYETNGITAGMTVLKPYLDDPQCLTSKRQEITRRLKGMETLKAGSPAPDISLNDAEGKRFELSRFETQGRYILLLFWSAGCSHCVEMVDHLFPWQQQPKVQGKMKVIAISLDETETEVKAWDQKIRQLTGWKHMRAAEGVRSKVAADYFVLATPVMVLLDAKTREIVATPDTPEELNKAMQEK